MIATDTADMDAKWVLFEKLKKKSTKCFFAVKIFKSKTIYFDVVYKNQ